MPNARQDLTDVSAVRWQREISFELAGLQLLLLTLLPSMSTSNQNLFIVSKNILLTS